MHTGTKFIQMHGLYIKVLLFMTMCRNTLILGQSGHINHQLNSMNHMLALVTLDYDKRCDDRLTTELKAHTKKPFMPQQLHNSPITCLIQQCPLMVKKGNCGKECFFHTKKTRNNIYYNFLK